MFAYFLNWLLSHEVDLHSSVIKYTADEPVSKFTVIGCGGSPTQIYPVYCEFLMLVNEISVYFDEPGFFSSLFSVSAASSACDSSAGGSSVFFVSSGYELLPSVFYMNAMESD